VTSWVFTRSCRSSSRSTAASSHRHQRKVSSVSLKVCAVLVCVYIYCLYISFGDCHVEPTGMTKMKVGMDDPSSVEFVERRRAALERQGSKSLFHTVMLLMRR